MTDYTELIHRLRETESRSKRKLLDEAAATIEAMAKDLREYAGCDACAHSNSECAASEQIGDNTQPSEASPVTIIHCRNCNHLAKLSSEIHGETKVCQIWWSMIRDPTSTFCSFGKNN